MQSAYTLGNLGLVWADEVQREIENTRIVQSNCQGLIDNYPKAAAAVNAENEKAILDQRFQKAQSDLATAYFKVSDILVEVMAIKGGYNALSSRISNMAYKTKEIMGGDDAGGDPNAPPTLPPDGPPEDPNKMNWALPVSIGLGVVVLVLLLRRGR